jgi:hypothetical protein
LFVKIIITNKSPFRDYLALKLHRRIGVGQEMIPIDFNVSGSKVKVTMALYINIDSDQLYNK